MSLLSQELFASKVLLFCQNLVIWNLVGMDWVYLFIESHFLIACILRHIMLDLFLGKILGWIKLIPLTQSLYVNLVFLSIFLDPVHNCIAKVTILNRIVLIFRAIVMRVTLFILYGCHQIDRVWNIRIRKQPLELQKSCPQRDTLEPISSTQKVITKLPILLRDIRMPNFSQTLNFLNELTLLNQAYFHTYPKHTPFITSPFRPPNLPLNPIILFL